MWTYNNITGFDELYHWGIQGQKWGIRRYQNPDGTLTEAGKKRYWGTGGEYTHVGRQRYIKDLVSDYNEINGTKIDAKKAIVKINGKYYNGKGVELDSGNLTIHKYQEKERESLEREVKQLSSDSVMGDFIKRPVSSMTIAELEYAKRYYETLNGYERAGEEYTKRHMKIDPNAADKQYRKEKIKQAIDKMLPILAGGVATVAVKYLTKKVVPNDSKDNKKKED